MSQAIANRDVILAIFRALDENKQLPLGVKRVTCKARQLLNPSLVKLYVGYTLLSIGDLANGFFQQTKIDEAHRQSNLYHVTAGHVDYGQLDRKTGDLKVNQSLDFPEGSVVDHIEVDRDDPKVFSFAYR
jgi:hypothetical protein